MMKQPMSAKISNVLLFITFILASAALLCCNAQYYSYQPLRTGQKLLREEYGATPESSFCRMSCDTKECYERCKRGLPPTLRLSAYSPFSDLGLGFNLARYCAQSCPDTLCYDKCMASGLI